METKNATFTNKHKKLSFIQLSIIIFTITCAGPFGVETAIQSGGVFYTLLGLIIVPFLYSIPQSLICAELGSMMPSYHGYILWVYRAYEKTGIVGEFFSFYNAIGSVLGLALDIPIYLVLQVFYFKRLYKHYFATTVYKFHFWEEYLIMLLLIIIGALFTISNITTLGNSTILFALIIFLPFLIGFVYSLPQTDFNEWTQDIPPDNNTDYQWGLFMSTLLWLHTGWDEVGCLSAEIGFNQNKLFYSFLFAMIIDYIAYTLPVLGALTIKCDVNDDSCWDDGYLYTAYDKIIPFLGIAVTISGLISNFGLYIAEMAVQARSFWALAQPYVILMENGTMYVEAHDNVYYNDDMEIIDIKTIPLKELNKSRRIRIGMLPKWLCGTLWDRTGAPVRAVLLQSFLCCILITFDFDTLLEATVLINCITWLIEYSAFLRLRYTEPNANRPYKVSGGFLIAWLITIIKFIVIIVLFVFVLYDNLWYGLITIISLVFSILWFIIYLWYYKYKNYENIHDNHEKPLLDDEKTINSVLNCE